ncbi:MAG: YihY family inner membrane protein [Campylobacterales bacterium]|nr:YihY family inner membrane protein [Campylobacterales bacterium]HEO99248.1 YihY family inner membrane protein [Campylobacterota bacterium]
MRSLLRHYYIFLRDFISELFDDKIGHYASSLSWSTLFSIIPLMVIILWVFTTLPAFEEIQVQIKDLIFRNLLPTYSKEVIDYINTFMENSYKLGYIGVLYVTVAAILFFKNYDYIVNDIFGVPNRGVFNALKTYGLLLLVIPLMMGISFYLSATMQLYLNRFSITSSIQLLYFVPFLIVWMVFYLLFQFSANTRVSVSSALISSFITSLVWNLSKNGFIYYILHNKTYMNIYGSVSTLLFFFLWIYVSWMIFLHGLKFCDLLNKEEEIEHI